MKKLLRTITKVKSSQIIIALIFTSIGIVSTVLAQNLNKNKENNSEPIFYDNFESVFSHLQKIEQEMDEIFLLHRKRMNDIFINSKKLEHQESKKYSKITKIENDNELIYELSFDGYKKDEIEVTLKENNLSFSAKNKEEEKSKNTISAQESNFYYSFYLPKYDINQKPEIIRKDNLVKVVIKKEI